MHQNWPVQPITTVADVNPKRSEIKLAEDELVDFVPMADVAEEFGGITLKSPRPAREVSKGYTQFQAGDVLFAKITPCMENGKVAVVPQLRTHIGYGSTEFHVFRPKPGIHPKWIGHFIARSDFRRSAQRNMSGSAGQLRVPSKWISEQQIPVPDPDVQEVVLAKIEELFSDLDAGVAALKRAQANLKRYRAAVLKAAVEGRLTEQWRAERKAKGIATEPAAKLLERILVERRKKWEAAQLKKYADAGKAPPKGWQGKYLKPIEPAASGLPEIVEGWRWSTLSQLSERFEYGTSVKCAYEATNEPVLRIPNIARGEIDLTDLKFSSQELGLNDEEALQVGDMLVCRTNGSISLIGKTALVKNKLEKNYGFASYLLRFRFVLSENLPAWVNLYMISFQGRRFIESNAASSAGQHNISLGLLSKMLFPLPSLEEQTEIVPQVEAKLSNIAQAETEIKRSLERAKRLRQAILKRAFEGRLV